MSISTPIPIFCESCDDTQYGGSIKVNKKNIYKADVTSIVTTDTLNLIGFRINSSIWSSSKSFDNNSNIESLEIDAYRCSAYETNLVNTSCKNKFILIAPGENVVPESLTNDIFWGKLSHPHLFPIQKNGFQIKREVPLSTSDILINVS